MYIKTFESFTSDGTIYYHGSSSALPFFKFDVNMIGTGIVSSRNKYGGFFFTSEIENAEYYTEYFIAKVKISNIVKNNSDETSPSIILKTAYDKKENILIPDILDGATYSDVVVVPTNMIDSIEILEWIFVGEEEYYFEKLDSIFCDEEGDTSIDNIQDMLSIMDIDIEKLKSIDIFNKYLESK